MPLRFWHGKLFFILALQLVGTKIYWEMSPQGIALLLKVIGVPFDATIPLNFGLSLQDFNQRDVLVHTFEGVTLFNLDFLTFLAQAQAIHLAIMKNQDRISSIFHIVFDNEKIELHFFEQKDYIQNLL